MSEQEVQVEQAGRVPGDTPCAKCAYNLQGLSAAGSCPECEYPIAKSVEQARLPRAPEWLGRAEWVYLACAVGSVLAPVAVMTRLVPQNELAGIIGGLFLPLIAAGCVLASKRAKYTKRWTIALIVVVAQVALLLLLLAVFAIRYFL